MSNFDFGFTAMTEDELSVVQETKAQAESASASAEEASQRAQIMYEAIIPLLNNLKQNPEKDYILWPKRLDKIEQFETHIQNIYKG